jgi:hypothetical protein
MTYNVGKTAKMILDLRNGNLKAFSENATSEKTNEAFRAKMSEMLPKPNAAGKYKYREMVKALPEVFAIIEEVIDITINDAWKASNFYNQFVDARNLALGDKAEFIIDADNWISVNRFSGNTWDTDREKVQGGKKISLDTSWFYAHVYDDFERFRLGAVTMETLLTKITDAFTRHIDTMIAVAYNDAASNLPAAFNIAATLTTADLRELIQKVKTASRANVNILGTEMAITRLNELAEVKYSNDMMNEVYSTGRLAKWMGNTVIEIPQAFTPGTYEWAVDNESLLIVPAGIDAKFIKFVDEGETRSRELTENETHDQTLDYQLQRKMGCGAVFGSMFGKYVIQ